MKLLLNKLWNFEFEKGKSYYTAFTLLVIFGIGTMYVLGEVLFSMNPNQLAYSLADFKQAITHSANAATSYEKFQQIFPYLWLAIASACIIGRMTIIISGYYLSKKAIGETAFNHYVITYFVSFIISMGSAVLLAYFITWVALGFGYNLQAGLLMFNNVLLHIKQMIDLHVPNLMNVQSYWLAIVLTIFLSTLPEYFIHWLCHQSRFFWLVSHRAHHTPQFLHSMVAPPAFAFEFLLMIPSGLVSIVISKLIYTQPLVIEMTLWLTFGYFFEIFNHSLVYYQFALNNFWIRNLSRLYGNRGVYHIMHHSAKEEDQMINLGPAPFNFWDRVFGTYRKPYNETPPVGLTNMPEMHLNPFRIVFNGFAQLAYELKMNNGLLTRLRIIFGGVYYKPPITKDFLIVTE